LITARDISVVVQGPVAPGGLETPNSTTAVLANVRRVLPEAELILSTWPGENLAGLAPDILVQPTDPGPQIMDATGKIGRKFNNVNRQIVSTLAGLRVATRPWAVKLRSDTCLAKDSFVRLLDENAPREERWKIFSARVVVCDIGCLNPRQVPALFHVSDLFLAGRTDDLRKLWDIPLAPEPETSQWLVGKARPWVVWTLDGFFTRYTPEQYIWMTCLRAHGRAFALAHPGDAPPRLAWKSERLFLNNFRPSATGDLGIIFSPRLDEMRTLGIQYTAENWSQLVEKTVARRAGWGFRLGFLKSVQLCRARYLWRNYCSRQPRSLLVQALRRRHPSTEQIH
jgi:hypothetical protein